MCYFGVKDIFWNEGDCGYCFFVLNSVLLVCSHTQSMPSVLGPSWDSGKI